MENVVFGLRSNEKDTQVGALISERSHDKNRANMIFVIIGGTLVEDNLGF